MPSVAIVILNYNGQAHLPACLASLAQLQTPVEVVVADNASTDGSLAWAQAHYPNVRYLPLGKNWGFAEGYNRALAQVQADWYGLVNNDATLAPDWVAVLLAAAERHPQAAIWGGKLRFSGRPPDRPILQSAGASFTDGGSAFEIGWGQPDTGHYDQPGCVGAIPGAALLIRRSAWEALGGFDAQYGAYLEDVDLCWRAWLRGAEVRYEPAAIAYHHYGGSTGGRLAPYRIQQMQQNRLANLVKHVEPGTLLWGAGVSVLYDAYRVLEYIGHGQWAALAALGTGTLHFGRAWPHWWAQRQHIQHTRTRTDAQLRQQGLLISAWAALREYRRLSRLAPR